MTATHDNPSGPEPLGHAHEAGFDRTMRQRHAESLERLSPATLARLRAARGDALAASRRARPFGWGLASAAAAVCAFAIGVSWLRSDPPAADPAPPTLARTATATDAGDALLAAEVEAVMAPLDEDPDLYLWLAANDDALPPLMER
ncbi:hypothetical protein [Marilutibacter maris]|uniref:Membrane protein n=1 Tax=Marilutibacter maris TaxID=1605891 RepID=A0A2U9T693_9GAMM|nr:hypothetical protein [Lysobacter maris]AWV08071.1 membrane protein [Lysobacter maris]